MARVALHGTSVVDFTHGSAGVQRGTCINRWYDKSLQIIVCQNGAAGVNFEHSVIDGHTVLRFASDVFTETILRFAETIRSNFARRQTAGMQSSGAVGGQEAEVSPVTYHRIEWQLREEQVAAMLIAESKLSDRIPQVDLQVLEFAAYGKNWIVEHKMSPDAFVQIALQVTRLPTVRKGKRYASGGAGRRVVTRRKLVCAVEGVA
jgi:carnitine O-acetyltransferase